MSKYEVIVIGAGPAGTAMAARLAKQGRASKILVLDRYHFPRDKPCGGGLTGHMESALEAVGLKLRVPYVPCDNALVRFGTLERTVPMERSVDIIRRSEFDADLVEQVRELGVEVLEGEGLLRYEVSDQGVVVHTTKGRSLHAEVLVGADGAASKVRKQILGNAKAIPHRLFTCELTMPRPPELAHSMTYDFTLMSKGLRGYLWVFPAPGDRINVGLMHYPAADSILGGAALTELLREGLKAHGIVLPDKGARGWPVWGYHPKSEISQSRVLTVGDAAGIDGLTGEGIAVAMEQAVVAGEAIEEAFATECFAFKHYRKKMSKAVVGRELALDRLLALMLYSDGKWWQEWLALILLDDSVLKLYAGRVDGTSILANHKWSLFGAYSRHLLKRGKRLKALRGHLEN